MVPLANDSREFFDGWRQPDSDNEGQTEKQILAKISALVPEGVEKYHGLEASSDENETMIVEAMRYIFYTQEASTSRVWSSFAAGS